MCLPNYLFNDTTNLCEWFECQQNYQCPDILDQNRHCDGGQCECLPNFEQDTSNGDKCMLVTQTNDYTWVYVACGLLILFIIAAPFLYFSAKYIYRRVEE